MKTRELQRMAKQLNKTVAPDPLIDLESDRETLSNDVEEVVGMLEKGEKIPQWLMDKIKQAEFNLPKGVGVEGGEKKVHTKKDIDNQVVNNKKEKATKKIIKEVGIFGSRASSMNYIVDELMSKGATEKRIISAILKNFPDKDERLAKSRITKRLLYFKKEGIEVNINEDTKEYKVEK